jgi:hypothetical protein
MAVYLKNSKGGPVRYMASVGAGVDRERKTFRSESAANAWEVTEYARRRSAKTVATAAPLATSSIIAARIGHLVETFLRCDEDSQRLIFQLATQLAGARSPDVQFAHDTDGNHIKAGDAAVS